jgi:hypothetical protein
MRPVGRRVNGPRRRPPAPGRKTLTRVSGPERAGTAFLSAIETLRGAPGRVR